MAFNHVLEAGGLEKVSPISFPAVSKKSDLSVQKRPSFPRVISEGYLSTMHSL